MSAASQSAPATWVGIYVERQDIAGEAVWAVTISCPGCDVRRRLFADRSAAYAYAMELADWYELPFFDLAEVPAK